MKIIPTTLLLGILLFTSCKFNNTKDVTKNSNNDTLIAKQQLHKIDSSLAYAYQTLGDTAKDIPRKLINEALEKNKGFVQMYPKDSYSPVALDKIQQLYQQLGNYRLSTEYGKLLIEKYPHYKNINEVMYSVATSFDFMLNDKKEALRIYEKMLDQKSNISKAIKSDIQFRINEIKRARQ